MAPLAILLLNIILWALIFGLIYYLGTLVLGLLEAPPKAYVIWKIVFLAIIIFALIVAIGGGTAGWRLIH